MRKHPRMVLVMFVFLCVVIAAALYMQGITNTPAQPPSQPNEQPALTGTAAQPAEAPATDANPTSAEGSTTAGQAPAVPDATVTQGSDSTQVNDSAENEDIQRQKGAAISHAEKPEVSPNAAYEPGVVLVTVREGTTTAQLVQAMADAGIKTVDRNDIEFITDDLVKAKLAPNATIDEAIYELESTGVAKSAQPNYTYEIA